MEGAERARDRVQERLDRLTEGDRSPTVNQETVVTNAEQYRRAIEQSLDGIFRIRVAVTNEADEVLLTPTDDGLALPCGETDPGEPIDTAAQRIAQAKADIECVPREAVEATISGVRNGDDPDAKAVYRLSVVYLADAADPSGPPEESCWEPPYSVDAPL